MSDEYKVSRPYAKAVFRLAFEKSELPKWSDMLNAAKLIITDENIQEMLKNPAYGASDVVKLIFDIAGESFDEQGRNLIHTLAKFKRLPFMPHICELYEVYRAEAERTIEVDLISAFAVSEEDQARIKQALKNKLQKEVSLDCKEDPAILAGAIIRSGDLLIDGSLRGKLARLGDSMGVF